MAKKVDSATAERLKALGIKAKNEDEAREKLLKILEDNDIDGMEEEDTDSLLDMCESMVEPEPEESDDDDEEEDDDRTDDEKEADELAEEEDDDEDDEEEDDDSDSDEDEDDEEEEEEKPAKKSVKKAEKTAAPAKKAAKPEKKEEKPAKAKAEKKPSAKRGVKLDPKNNKDDRKAFKFLEKYFPTDKYDYCWIAMNGVTIKYKGKNSSRAVISMEICSKQSNGDITCNLYMLTFSKSLEVLDEAGMEYGVCWNGAPFMRGITFSEVEDTIKELLPHMEEFVGKIDKRLGDNRKKMEDSLKKTTKKEVEKKSKTKVEEPEDEDDEEEDDEDEKPAKKYAKKSAAPVKKSKKAAEPEDEDDDEEDDEEDDEPKKPAKKAKKGKK